MLNHLFKWLVLLSLPFSSIAQATSVVFLNPGHTDEVFWTSYSHFMQAAAGDLGLDLKILYSERDPQRVLAQAREVLQSPDKPDYLMFVNEQYVAPEILRLARNSGVKLFLVNNNLTPDQTRLLGERQNQGVDLIGSMVPNDEEGGYLMLKELIRLRHLAAPGQPIELLAFTGTKTTPSAQYREAGMRRALAEHPDVHLRQIAVSEWNRERAYEQARQLLKRYPKTNTVWAANDEMAFGAMRAFEEAGRVPGKDVLFSGVNSSNEALQARIDGRMSVLLAGHFSLGGWALVLIQDHARGIDFTRFGGRDRQVPLLQLVDEREAKRLMLHSDKQNYGVEFKTFTGKGRALSYRYPFSLQALMR